MITSNQKARRSLMLALRRNYKGPIRRLGVKHLGGVKFEYVCKTCGHTWSKEMLNCLKEPMGSPAMMQWLARYQDRNGGVSGPCPKCTQKARDEKYPLKPV